MFNQREGGDPMSFENTALVKGHGFEVLVTGMPA
jgi:hypothetical protein